MLNLLVWIVLFFALVAMCIGVFIGITAKHKSGRVDGIGLGFAALFVAYFVPWVASLFGWKP